MRRAGTPATSAWAGTSRVTTEPAATVAHSPIVTGATHTARAPTELPRFRVTPTGSQSWALFDVPSGLTARGKVSLVSTAAGPTKTPSSRCAGS